MRDVKNVSDVEDVKKVDVEDARFFFLPGEGVPHVHGQRKFCRQVPPPKKD